MRVASRMNKRTNYGGRILLFFVLCAISDFVWGYIKGRSISEALIRVIFGLFGTALIGLLAGMFRRRSEKESNTSQR